MNVELQPQVNYKQCSTRCNSFCASSGSISGLACSPVPTLRGRSWGDRKKSNSATPSNASIHSELASGGQLTGRSGGWGALWVASILIPSIAIMCNTSRYDTDDRRSGAPAFPGLWDDWSGDHSGGRPAGPGSGTLMTVCDRNRSLYRTLNGEIPSEIELIDPRSDIKLSSHTAHQDSSQALPIFTDR